ncbi:MAG: sugar transferase, partial [Acidobacteriota bacterium]
MSTIPLTDRDRIDSPPPAGLPRSADVFLAAFGLILGLPLLVICTIAVALTSPGPVIFRQRRVGRRGAFFMLLKFRTMWADAPGLLMTGEGDSRVTPIGRLLRKTRLDELPALINVLLGDLSLVGPRPEIPRFVDLGNPLWRLALQVRPGLTDPVTLILRNEESLLASVDGNPETFYRDVLQPYKLRGYARYLEQRTWWSDIEVLGRTALAMVRPSSVPPPSIADLSRPRPEAAEVAPDTEQSSRAGAWRRVNLRDIQYLFDLLVLAAAFAFAYLLRFDFQTDAGEVRHLATQLPWVLALQFGALLLARVHRFIWRYVGMREGGRFVNAAIWSGGILLALRLFVPDGFQQWRIPISIIFMDTLLGFGGVFSLRVARRIAYERSRRGLVSRNTAPRRRVLLLGAGQAGVLAAREILGRGDLDI